MSAGNVLTVLRCAPGFVATKTWTHHQATQSWAKEDYRAGTWFTPQVREVSDIETLGAAVKEIHADPSSYIVRAELADWVAEEQAQNPRLRIRRKKNATKGYRPALVEAPLRWIILDWDGLPLRDVDDLADEPDLAIAHAIEEHLPPEFHGVKCFWQLSASAGFSANLLKCHLFFWLDSPVTNEALKAVVKQHAPSADWKIHHAAALVHLQFTSPMISKGYSEIAIA